MRQIASLWRYRLNSSLERLLHRLDPAMGADRRNVSLSKAYTGQPARCTPSPGNQMDQNLKIVIVDESAIRAAILEEGLREAGYAHVMRIGETKNLLARIYALDPDVILIDLENPSRDVLEQMFQVSRAVRRPIAMFVDQSDAASIQASVDAGVSAYIVDGLKKERIKPILDLCISRFNAFAKLQDELDRTKSALEDRKVIDRAKGILMKLKGLTEDEAYVLLRSTAMREKKKIGEIAQSILTASEILK
jgi:two-component system, response regulator / RNA-binding antiterminator